MTQEALPFTAASTEELSTDIAKASRKARSQSIVRMARYTVLKLLALFVTVVIGVYIAVLIANMGGHVDEIRRSQIREGILLATAQDIQFQQMNQEERTKLIEAQIALAEQRFGLDQPFYLRSFRYLTNAITLNFGYSDTMSSDSGSRFVRNILLERLPSTLLLFGTANLLLFFIALFAGLSLSRRYGSMSDKTVLALAPTSAAPAWFYGLFLILIFAAVLKVLPFGGMVSAPPPDNPLDYAASLGRHMILPIGAWMLSSVFLTTYNWRTFFLIYSSEDYVEMAKAKGLSDRMIERRYVLRPTLPNIITSFALLLITLWTGAIIFETVFNWPGVGELYFRAINAFDTPVIVANVVLYAYLLAITVFLLDFVYALVDPRVRIGGGERKQ